MKSKIFIFLFLPLLAGCEDTVFRSSVPSRPVQLTINTEEGIYVHLQPANIGECLIVDNKGFHYHGQTLPLKVGDYYGFAGVAIYVDNNNKYTAFDLCCPKCVKQFEPCRIDGIFAVCPVCGEKYDISYGYCTPSLGHSKEALRKYTVMYNNARLHIHD